MKIFWIWLNNNANAISALTAMLIGLGSIFLSIYSCILEKDLYNLQKQNFIPIFQFSYSYLDKDNNSEQMNISNIGSTLISSPDIIIKSFLEISRFSYDNKTSNKICIPIYGYWESHLKKRNLKNDLYSVMGKNNNKYLFDLQMEILKHQKGCSYGIIKKDYILISYTTITGENKTIYFKDGKLIDSNDYIRNIFVNKKIKIYNIKDLTFSDIESLFADEKNPFNK